MSKPILSQVNLICGNVDASILFYRRLGLEIPESGVWRTSTGAHHTSTASPAVGHGTKFDLDSSAYAQHWAREWEDRADLKGRVVLGFHLPARTEIDDLFSDMTSVGYRGLQEPYDAPWGARFAILEDPDGVAVGLMSPPSQEKKSPPPDL